MAFPDPPARPSDTADYKITIAETLERTGLSKRRFQRWRSSGLIPTFRRGRSLYITQAHAEWLKRFLEAHLTLSEAVQLYGVPKQTLNRRWDAHKIDGLKIGGTLYLEKAYFAQYRRHVGGLVKVSQAAKMLGIGRMAFYRIYERGHITSQGPAGTLLLFLPSDVEALRPMVDANPYLKRTGAGDE